MGEWGIAVDSAAGRAEFAGRMEARRCGEGAGECEPAGWYLGSAEFRDEWLAQVDLQAGPRHTGQQVWDSAQAQAALYRKEPHGLTEKNDQGQSKKPP